MKNKQIGLVVNKKDIRSLISHVLGLILTRENMSRTEAIKTLDEACKSGDVEDIVAALSELVEVAAQAAQELQNMSPLINELSEKEELVSPDTEVLEDLPDLKEDSLRVDDGSE